jgi:cyclopropane-fatty-acyl-phospholipid synthase
VLDRWIHGAIRIRLPDGRVLSAGRGDHPARVEIRDHRFLMRILSRGELGAGESFVAGEWDSPDLVHTLRLFLRNLAAVDLDSSPLTRIARIPALIRHRLRANDRAGSRRNIHAHYDLGNDFYRLFLGDTWVYSCGLWRDGAGDLDAAQNAKLERICGLLDLDRGDHLLEIGCGWGSLAMWAARTRGCRVTAITVSSEQRELARARVRDAGLDDLVDIQFCDYRDLDGRFDKIASIEMIEAVGHQYLPAFFSTCAARLRPGGLLALQSILMPDHKFEAYRRSIDWTQTYIFPGSLIPSLGALASAWSRAGFGLESFSEIGTDYAPTLAVWRERFVASLPQVHALGFDEPFVRLWTLYLSFSEAAFAERSLGDGHVLLRRM